MSITHTNIVSPLDSQHALYRREQVARYVLQLDVQHIRYGRVWRIRVTESAVDAVAAL